MAFNPFDAFRKNSKPLMAALTIFVMFVFVLSTGGGGGDFFDWVARQFGGNDSRGKLMGTIDGSDIYEADLQSIRQRRAAANAFMSGYAELADEKMMAQIRNDIEKGNVRDPQITKRLEDEMSRRRTFMMSLQNITMRELPFVSQFFYDQSQNLMTAADRLADNPNDARLLRYMSKIFYHDSIRMRSGGEMYFSRVGNQNDQQAMQFAIFQKLADTKDIKFVDDDIRRLIRSEMEIDLSREEANLLVQRVLRNTVRGLSPDQIVRAIGDEFRVLTVMKVAEGSDFSGRPNVPVGMTPFEFYEFYKDRIRELSFDIVDVPTEPFLSQVTQAPTDKELKDYYDKYKALEFEPSRETPGFKEPRKVKIEYVEVDATKPAYKASIPFIEAAALVGGGSSLLSAGSVPGAMAVAAPLLAEPLLAKNERKMAEEFTSRREVFRIATHGFGPPPAFSQLFTQLADKGAGLPMFGLVALRAMSDAGQKLLPARTLYDLPPREANTFSALPIAAMIGQLAMPVDPVMALGGAVVAARDVTELLETRDRIKFGLQLTLAPLNPLFTAAPIIAAGPALANLPTDVPEILSSQFTGRRIARRPEAIAQKDLESLEKALDDLRKSFIEEEKNPLADPRTPPKIDPKKVDIANAEARKLIDTWIKNHSDARTGKSSTLLDRFRIGDAAELKDVFGSIKDTPEYKQIVQMLFYNPQDTNTEASKFKPWVLADVTQQSNFNQSSRDFSKPMVMAWKVDDREAKSYDKYDLTPQEIKDDVLKAWRMEKARELARKAADEFADKVRALAKKELRDSDNPGAFNAGLIDLANSAKFGYIPDAAKVAKLKRNVPIQGGQRERQQARYQGPAITNKQIEFPLSTPTPGESRPGSAMADLLVELRNDPVGDVLVVPNQPKSHYYVSVMTRKQDLTINNFYTDVFTLSNMPEGKAADRDTLLGAEALRDLGIEFQKDLDQRIRAELRVTESEDLKKPDQRSTE